MHMTFPIEFITVTQPFPRTALLEAKSNHPQELLKFLKNVLHLGKS